MKFNRIKLTLIIATALLFSGCATTNNPGNEYGDAPKSNPKSKSWAAEVKNYELALQSNSIESSPVGSQAISWYEYGRALGVVCRFEESEEALLKANELDGQAGQPLYYSLTELARLHFDQGNYSLASNYYKKTLTELDKINSRIEAPIAYADILEEYSISLDKTNQTDKAKTLREDASNLRQSNPSGYSVTDRTPYGSQCE